MVPDQLNTDAINTMLRDMASEADICGDRPPKGADEFQSMAYPLVDKNPVLKALLGFSTL